jgi:hypothetical protein
MSYITYIVILMNFQTIQGCIFFYNPPPGVGEKNQRVLGLGKKEKSRKNGKAEGKEENNFRG